jgi:hypothetical protein
MMACNGWYRLLLRVAVYEEDEEDEEDEGGRRHVGVPIIAFREGAARRRAK